MSNFDRAVKVLDAQGAYCGQCSREPGDFLDDCRDCAAVLETYAHALEAAGLLAPDLPEPEPNKYDPNADPYWRVRQKQGGQTVVTADTSGLICVAGLGIASVTGARALALALLAAADYAEKEQDNE